MSLMSAVGRCLLRGLDTFRSDCEGSKTKQQVIFFVLQSFCLVVVMCGILQHASLFCVQACCTTRFYFIPFDCLFNSFSN